MTNLATSEFSWALTPGLVTLVVAQAGLSWWQALTDRGDRREARDQLLEPLRASPPVPPGGELAEGAAPGAGAVALWLTASVSPTPLWARGVERDRLVAWCVRRDPAEGVARVVTGPAGVGKSLLARVVAESLSPEWATGRGRGQVR
ncbi:hypothetical protein [Amycolatopsis sp. lyj-84]|uniref:hypothetical protein n=1 Tax=Amycolatopsis sp. lyj-84 TaxID=2789284 RepID=UPI00397B0A6D